MAYQNKKELSFIYSTFRPMLEELLKLDIDFSQDDASDQEIDVFIKWMNENTTDIVSDEDIHKFNRSIVLKRVHLKQLSGFNDSAEYVGPNLSDDLKKFKEQEEINIVWTLKASCATLENFSMMYGGQNARNYNSKFKELLEKLHFSEKAKNIYSYYNEKSYFRFNAVKDPDKLMEELYSTSRFFVGGTIQTIKDHYAKNDWLENFKIFKDLLDLWEKKDTEPQDYLIYYKTTEILLHLIPVITENGILMTKEQYKNARSVICKEIINYCKENEYVIKSPILQGIKEYTHFKDALEHLLDLFNDENLNKDLEPSLMLVYEELLNSFIKQIENTTRFLNEEKIMDAFYHNPDDLSMKNSSKN